LLISVSAIFVAVFVLEADFHPTPRPILVVITPGSPLGPHGPSRDILDLGRGPRRHRRGAFANRDLPYGGPSPYRVPSGPSFAPCRSEAKSSGSSEQELVATRWPLVFLHLGQGRNGGSRPMTPRVSPSSMRSSNDPAPAQSRRRRRRNREASRGTVAALIQRIR